MSKLEPDEALARRIACYLCRPIGNARYIRLSVLGEYEPNPAAPHRRWILVAPDVRFDRKRKNSFEVSFPNAACDAAIEWAVDALVKGYKVTRWWPGARWGFAYGLSDGEPPWDMWPEGERFMRNHWLRQEAGGGH